MRWLRDSLPRPPDGAQVTEGHLVGPHTHLTGLSVLFPVKPTDDPQHAAASLWTRILPDVIVYLREVDPTILLDDPNKLTRQASIYYFTLRIGSTYTEELERQLALVLREQNFGHLHRLHALYDTGCYLYEAVRSPDPVARRCYRSALLTYSLFLTERDGVPHPDTTYHDRWAAHYLSL